MSPECLQIPKNYSIISGIFLNKELLLREMEFDGRIFSGIIIERTNEKK
jgi:hypothetical protein